MTDRESWFLNLGPRRIELPSGQHVVGRSRDCDVVVRDATVSRAHALVAVARDRVTVQDLGSSNGTMVNGQTVRTETELAAGDQLRLGRVRMTLARTSAPAAAGDPSCPACGAAVAPDAVSCRACGEPLSGSRPLSRSEAVAMSEVMAVGEALARPAPSLDATLPPFPAAWPDVSGEGEGPVAEGETSVDLGGPPPAAAEAPAAAFEDPSSPLAIARAAEEDSPLPRSPREASEAADAVAEVEPESRGAGEAAWPPLFLPAAGFWPRAAAFLVDLAGPLLLGLVVGIAAGGAGGPIAAAAGVAVGVAAWLAISVSGWRRRGETPGKRLLGLRVCDLDGRPGLDRRTAWLRFGGYLLGVLSCGVGFLPVALSAGRRGLHDRLAGTYVARVGRGGRLL